MFQFDVSAEYLVECFPGFLLRLLSIGFGLFDTDDLTAFGTFAEEMTGAIHFVPWAKPTHIGQFRFLHAPSFPLAEPFSHPLLVAKSRFHSKVKTCSRMWLLKKSTFA